MALHLLKYGAAGQIEGVPLIETNGVDYKVDPTLAAGDAQGSKDGGALANLATLPSVVPAGSRLVRVSLSAAELTCKQLVIQLVDAAGAEWEDQLLHVWTFGHASAQFAVDWSSPTVTLADGGLTAAKIAADAIGASELAASAVSEIIDAIKAMNIDGQSFDHLVAFMAAALVGTLSGAATNSIRINQVDGSVERIRATVDPSGNRHAVTLTPPS